MSLRKMYQLFLFLRKSISSRPGRISGLRSRDREVGPRTPVSWLHISLRETLASHYLCFFFLGGCLLWPSLSSCRRVGLRNRWHAEDMWSSWEDLAAHQDWRCWDVRHGFPLGVTVSTRGKGEEEEKERKPRQSQSVRWEPLSRPGRATESVAGQRASLGVLSGQRCHPVLRCQRHPGAWCYSSVIRMDVTFEATGPTQQAVAI